MLLSEQEILRRKKAPTVAFDIDRIHEEFKVNVTTLTSKKEELRA
jgi:hypothetical protein